MDVSFWFKISSEPDYDVLIFKIDGIEVGRWSVELDWMQAGYHVGEPGWHWFRWGYVKDESISKGSDTCWIDSIIFPPSGLCEDEGGFYVIPNKTGKASVIYLE